MVLNVLIFLYILLMIRFFVFALLLSSSLFAGERSFETAIQLIENQRSKEAFCAFFEAIDIQEHSFSGEEVYDDHMKVCIPLYLESMYDDRAAEKLEKELEARKLYVTASHPLNILLGCSSANKGCFSAFFKHVYEPIQTHLDSYLAWKVRGMVCVKIFEASSSMEERLLYKKRAIDCFQKAYQRLPEDMLLAVKILFFAQENQQEELFCAKKIFFECTRRPLLVSFVSKRGMQQVVREYVDLAMYKEVRQMLALYKQLFGYSRAMDEIELSIDCYKE